MSNQEAINARAKYWIQIYEYYQKDCPPEHVLKMYAEDLLQFSPAQISAAFEEYRKKSTFPPKPGDLIPLISQPLQIQDMAQLYAQRLMQCVAFYETHGTCWPEAAEKWIRQHCGEDLGWAVVQQLGGWRNLWDRSSQIVKDPEMKIGAWRKMFDGLLRERAVDGDLCLPSAAEAKQVMGEVEKNVLDFKQRQAGEKMDNDT